MIKIVIIVLALVVFGSLIFWKFGPDLSLISKQSLKPSDPVTISYWGLSDEDKIRPLIDDFQKQNSNIHIVYTKQNLVHFRTRVQAQLRTGSGPDIFDIHNSWLAEISSDLSSAPNTIATPAKIKNDFYPIAATSFVSSNKVYALPLGMDGLAMYYNIDLLTNAGVQVPNNWADFATDAVKMTVKDSTGKILTSGAALGTTNNVDFWPDLIGLLMLQQPGLNLTNPDQAGADVLKFYTGFSTDSSKKTWDRTLPQSSDMFASGNLAFYFGSSSKAVDFRKINPNLNFKVSPVPQLPGGSVAWGSFWGVGVSSVSKNQAASWLWVDYLTSKEGQKLGYSTDIVRNSGAVPYSRIDIGSDIINDPVAGAYVKQGPIAKFWYLSSGTMDDGLNDEMINLWKPVVDGAVSQDPKNLIQGITPQIQQILNKYLPQSSGQSI